MADLARIRLVVCDVDGCLTDGSVYVDADGRESCRYSKRDGVLLPVMREAGIEVVSLTAEIQDNPHHARMRKLGLDRLVCSPTEKLSTLKWLCEARGVTLSEVCYIGDDLPDLPCLEAVTEAGGVAFVPDYSPVAALDVSRYSNWPKEGPPTLVERFFRVSAGGDGCLRDVCEVLLKARGYDLGTWPPVRR